MRASIDRMVAALLLVLASPLLLAVAVAVRLRLGSPVLFRQARAGLGGDPFELWKFRTMSDAVGLDGRLLSDEERLTPFGAWLRSTSLDELPELWNVVRGEMALVGPRPLPVGYLDRYTEEEARRHDVRPGLTGWAQVHGRNSLSWDQRLAMDVWYVDNRSLLLDVRILALTVRTVLARQGVSGPGMATMAELRPPPAG